MLLKEEVKEGDKTRKTEGGGKSETSQQHWFYAVFQTVYENENPCKLIKFVQRNQKQDDQFKKVWKVQKEARI